MNRRVPREKLNRRRRKRPVPRQAVPGFVEPAPNLDRWLAAVVFGLAVLAVVFEAIR